MTENSKGVVTVKFTALLRAYVYSLTDIHAQLAAINAQLRALQAVLVPVRPGTPSPSSLGATVVKAAAPQCVSL